VEGTETLERESRIPSLCRWGLTPDADLVYRTLVAFGPAAAPELATMLGMSRRRIQDGLDALGQAGAVGQRILAHGQPAWIARDIAAVTADLRRRRDLRRPPVPVPGPTTARDCLVPVTAGVHQLEPGLRYLATRAITRQRLTELIGDVAFEHLTINPEASFDASSTSAAAPLDDELARRRVSVRVLGVQPLDPAAFPAVHSYDYRQADQLPMKLIVIDRQVALFPVEPLDYERGYLEVSQPPVVKALVACFEKYWAEHLTRGTRSDPGYTMPTLTLTPREQALIGLLVAGHTDATAAQELRISERSVTSIMRSLMDRVGVDNRFQLGVALGTLRAVPVTPGLAARVDPSPFQVGEEES